MLTEVALHCVAMPHVTASTRVHINVLWEANWQETAL